MRDKSLHFGKPLLWLMGFTLFLAVAIGVLTLLSKQRQERVYQRYATETEAYIAKNRPALLAILASASAQYDFCAFHNNYYSVNYNSDCYQDQTLADRITSELSHDLVDWSSTAFFFSSKKGREVGYLRLSGEMGSASLGEPEQKVKDLLEGKVERLTWDDYTYLFDNKEVIIPVKDQSGKVVGAVVRGVIEQKSF